MLIRVLSLVVAGLGSLSLVGCDSSSDSTRTNGKRVVGETVENHSAVDLPPAVKASRIFRCEDRRLVYVDLLTDDVTARLRRKTRDVPILLRAPSPGQPFLAEGYSLSADQTRIEISRPGQGPVSCIR